MGNVSIFFMAALIILLPILYIALAYLHRVPPSPEYSTRQQKILLETLLVVMLRYRDAHIRPEKAPSSNGIIAQLVKELESELENDNHKYRRVTRDIVTTESKTEQESIVKINDIEEAENVVSSSSIVIDDTSEVEYPSDVIEEDNPAIETVARQEEIIRQRTLRALKEEGKPVSCQLSKRKSNLGRVKINQPKIKKKTSTSSMYVLVWIVYCTPYVADKYHHL